MLPRHSTSRVPSLAALSGSSRLVAIAVAAVVIFLLGYAFGGPSRPLPAVPAAHHTPVQGSGTHTSAEKRESGQIADLPHGVEAPQVIVKEVIKEVIKEVPVPGPAVVSISQECASYSNIYAKYQDFFDGCESIYLDFGTNTGVQIMKLMQPDYFPGAQILPHFDKYFGNENARRKSVCAMGFEPNPNHMKRLKDIEDSYNRQGWRTYMSTETGIGAKDGWLLFQTDGDRDNMEWGGKLVDAPSGVDENTPGAIKVASAVCVMEAVAARSVPAKSTVVPHIVMKIDIEGADETVLASMLRSGHLCSVDFIYVEHVSHEMADIFSRALQKAGCNTLISIIDDESYHRSNFDLPA